MVAAPYRTDESGDGWVGALGRGFLWDSSCYPRPAGRHLTRKASTQEPEGPGGRAYV